MTIRLLYEPDPPVLEPLDATIAITTLNRREEALTAVRSACAQEGCRFEVIVLDGGSSDGTVESLHEVCPAATVYRSDDWLDLLTAKNFIARVGRGEFMVGLDDDVELIDRRTVAATLADFAAGEDIGAVAVPYRELAPDGEYVKIQHPSGPGVEVVDTFIACAYAVRRELFVALGGYWDLRAGEERDFCLRMLQAGYVVRIGTAPALVHRPSPIRNISAMAFNAHRSDVQFALRRVPRQDLPWHMVRTTANLLRAGAVIGRGRYAPYMTRGFLSGLRPVQGARAPVQRDVYKLSLRLRRRGPLPLADVRAALARRTAAPGVGAACAARAGRRTGRVPGSPGGV